MKYYLIVVLTVLAVLASSPVAHSAHVGNPAEIFAEADKEKPYLFFTEGLVDYVYDRRAKHQTDQSTVDFYGATAGIRLYNIISFYGGMGAASLQEEFDVDGTRVRWESEYGLTWLAGAMIRLYEGPVKVLGENKLFLALDGQYRNTDLDPELVTIGSLDLSIPDSSITHASMEYNDWHLALACGIEMGALRPYIGAKYSDFESTARVTRNGVVYQKDNIEADDNFGVFLGVGVSLTDSITASAEASFLDEDSLCASLLIVF